MTLLSDLVSLFWPRTCAACGEKCEGQVCESCAAAVSARLPDLCCAVCGKTILASDGAAGTASPTCAGCRARHPAFDAARSAVDYDGPAKAVAKALKYHKCMGLAPWMAEWMHGCAMAPVPLHYFREVGRGYNQAALLARALARRLGADMAEKALRRTRWTGTQTKLDAAARRRNMVGAFALRPGFADAVPGKRILLVDDVMTTGATLDAAAKVLKAAGAGKILALTFARG